MDTIIHQLGVGSAFILLWWAVTLVGVWLLYLVNRWFLRG